MADSYERVILAKPDVFIYQIPPRGSTTRAVRYASVFLQLKITVKSRSITVSLMEDCKAYLHLFIDSRRKTTIYDLLLFVVHSGQLTGPSLILIGRVE